MKNDLMSNLRMSQLQNSRIQNDGVKKGENAKKNENALKNGELKNNSFENILNKKLETKDGIVFSKHANDRLVQRNIKLESEDIKKLENAFDIAKEKGIKSPLIVSDKMICIGSTASKTVVTAMDDMKNKVFTNIDGVINI
jgi:flagellar operon protein